MNREKIKMLIELSASADEADAVIREQGFCTIREKIAFLKGMFDFKLIGRYDDVRESAQKIEEMDYYAILSTIINEKWEA